MKPLIIEFQAFGSYRTKETVDFTELSSNGLFLICGKTGTGKSTILDAVTFALYGKSSGGGRNDFSQMRCKTADTKTPTYVKLEFENNGNHYIFERRLEMKRTAFHTSYNVMQMDSDGQWQVLFENCKESDINKKAVEIIGLDYEQFVQVIILPQGKFEKLLTSDSKEKEKILLSIFGEDKWKDIAERIYTEAEKRKRSITEKRDAALNSLHDEGCESVDELTEKVNIIISNLSEIEEDFKKKDYAGIIKENQELLANVKLFEELDREEQLSNELINRAEWRKDSEERLNLGKKAAALKPLIENVELLTKEYEARASQQTDYEKELAKAQENSVDDQKKLSDHLLGSAEIEKKKVLVVQYEEKRKDYEVIDKITEELNIATSDVKRAEKAEREASDISKSYDETIVMLTREHEKLTFEHKEMLESHIAGITGELAAELEEGSPCPVCGSTSHPKKAKKAETTVSKEQVDEKYAEKEEKYNELQTALSKKTEFEERVKELHLVTESERKRVIEISARLKNVENSLVDGVITLEDLSNRIQKLSQDITNYEHLRSELEGKEKASKEAIVLFNAKIETAVKETKDSLKKLRNAQELLESGIKEKGFADITELKGVQLDDSKLEELTKRIAEYDSDVKNNSDRLCKLRSDVAGLKRPDRTACEAAIDEATKASESHAKEIAVLNADIIRLSAKEKKLREQTMGMAEDLAEAEADLRMAKNLRGDTGVGLQRYVLGIMFSSVINAANQMLMHFNGGRYKLFRTDEKSSTKHQGGLELKVLDKYVDDPNGRFVSSLSGGEKFLASLALSIGMSSIARQGGIKIDAMFIDEGFGSLDEECIDDAMNILNSIQRENGVVGIISHVKLLRERIPAKLMVEGGRDGSRIINTIG